MCQLFVRISSCGVATSGHRWERIEEEVTRVNSRGSKNNRRSSGSSVRDD